MQVTKEGDGEEMMPPEEDEGEEGGDGENCDEADEEVEDGSDHLGGGSMKVRQLLTKTDEGLQIKRTQFLSRPARVGVFK